MKTPTRPPPMPKKNNNKAEEGNTEEPIPELGSGWKRVGEKRNSGTTADTFVSPGGKVFKTKGDAKKFIGLLEENGGGKSMDKLPEQQQTNNLPA